MLRFTGQKTISGIVRITGYAGNLSTSTTVAGGTCYLRPLSEVENSVNGFQYGQGFQVITEVDFDIREQDKIKIDGQDYLVRGVATHDRGISTQYRKAIVYKPQD